MKVIDSKSRQFKIFLICLLVLFPYNQLFACDFCASYYSILTQLGSAKKTTLSVSNQYSHSDSSYLPEDIPGAKTQRLDSNQTLISVGYQANAWLNLQLTVPFIHRKYRRLVDDQNEYGSESGLGDMTAVARFFPINIGDDDYSFVWETRFGLELPTGDSDRLGEESEDGHFLYRHGGASSSLLGGEDLALGSGSFDFPLGTRLIYQTGPVRGMFELDYIIRTEGDYDYEYGDDSRTALSLSYFPVLEDELTLESGLSFIVESMQNDYLRGNKIPVSSSDDIYISPFIRTVLPGSWLLYTIVDIPVKTDDSDTQLTPDYRVSAALSYNF